MEKTTRRKPAASVTEKPATMQVSSLARYARPKTLAGLVGQTAIRDTVKGFFVKNKMPSSILLCGHTGCGKTTTARIIARYLNCLNLTEDKEPCGECVSCKMDIEDHTDVVEVDGATTRGIDDVRKLIDLAKVMPMYGRKRVIIVDEAQQWPNLTQQALLKTLEQSPAHTLFILCSMQPEKLIPAINNRCLTLRIKPIEPDVVAKRLKVVSKREGAVLDDVVYTEIAARCGGSMREALSILENILFAHASNPKMDATQLIASYATTTEMDLDNAAVNVVLSITGNSLRNLIGSISPTDPNIRGVINKMRWLLMYYLDNTAKQAKYMPNSAKTLNALLKENELKVKLSLFVKLLYLINKLEMDLNTSSIDERVLFIATLGDFMTNLQEE